jgi:hypothetical protein
MGIQQLSEPSHSPQTEAINAQTCMAIIWVQNSSRELDKDALIDSVEAMSGVSDAKFTRETPAIMMINYCSRETKARDWLNP